MKKLIYLLALIITFSACKKESTSNHFKGNYTGTFRTSLGTNKVITDTEITFSDNLFKVNKGAKLASGTFKINNSKTVTFEDKNIWTADFDWNLILNGSFEYEIKGDSLILSRNLNTNPASSYLYPYYEYRLKRNN
ncbi:hypothetical protein [Pedobacter frigiditerrae]|uniref:hypothetical protein n=1 Tax=Pedobacter frigiditerrae TaxID=2530452 RepID=UPI00292D229E|nr:hypothetical protein [Pedobacter frigiditerrae]